MKRAFAITSKLKNDELLEITKPIDLRDIAALVAQSEKAFV